MFLPAVKALLSGSNPYSIHGFYNPVWILFPLIPLAWLPTSISQVVFSSFGFLVYAGTLLSRRSPSYALFAFLISPVVILSLAYTTTDWIPLLGIFLRPPIGLFLVMLKPQIGIGIALYWAFAAYRIGGWRSLLQTLSPVLLLGLANLVIFGLPPTQELTLVSWNVSIFPWSIPVGLGLLAYAIQKSKPWWTFPASIFLSPYVSFTSLVAVFPALPPLGIAATSLLLWIYGLLRWLQIGKAYTLRQSCNLV